MGDVLGGVKSMSPNGCTTSTTARALYIDLQPGRQTLQGRIWRAFWRWRQRMRNGDIAVSIARNLCWPTVSKIIVRRIWFSASSLPARLLG